MRQFRKLCSLALAKQNLWGSAKAECHLHTMGRVCAFIPSHRACAESLLYAWPHVSAASTEMKVCSETRTVVERNPKATYLAKYRARRDHGMSPYMSRGMGRDKEKEKQRKGGRKGRRGWPSRASWRRSSACQSEEISKNY
ncbi:unnamed protein product [Rangifer tarandus platyrhynchus]|uniref:Uncharacterized protein n=1 Tax=Rangifer tarandus platyrhynchus TaxID=3082113 RepID=A0AC59YDU9_RANTA